MSRITEEKTLIYYYLLIYMINNLLNYYFDYYPRLLFAVLYLWILFIFLYHLFISKKYLKNKDGILCLLFLAVNIFCTFRYKANWRFSVFQDFGQLILFMPVCLLSITDKNQFNRFLKTILGVHFVFSFFGAVGECFDLPYIVSFMPDRGSGLYHDINESSIVSFSMISLSVYYLRSIILASGNSGWIRDKRAIFHVINIIIHFILLAVSKGRTSFICLFLELCIISYHDLNHAFRNSRHWRKVRAALFALIVLLIYIIGFSKYGPDRNMYSFLHGENSFLDVGSMSVEQFELLMARFLSGRYSLWIGSIQTIIRSPLLGYGLKSSGFTYGFDPVIGPNSHNLILNTLLFSGIAGTVLLVYILFVFCRKMSRTFCSGRYLPLKMFIYMYLLSSMLETNVLYNGKMMNVLFWIILGYGIHAESSSDDCI